MIGIDTAITCFNRMGAMAFKKYEAVLNQHGLVINGYTDPYTGHMYTNKVVSEQELIQIVERWEAEGWDVKSLL